MNPWKVFWAQARKQAPPPPHDQRAGSRRAAPVCRSSLVGLALVVQKSLQDSADWGDEEDKEDTRAKQNAQAVRQQAELNAWRSQQGQEIGALAKSRLHPQGPPPTPPPHSWPQGPPPPPGSLHQVHGPPPPHLAPPHQVTGEPYASHRPHGPPPHGPPPHGPPPHGPPPHGPPHGTVQGRPPPRQGPGPPVTPLQEVDIAPPPGNFAAPRPYDNRAPPYRPPEVRGTPWWPQGLWLQGLQEPQDPLDPLGPQGPPSTGPRGGRSCSLDSYSSYSDEALPGVPPAVTPAAAVPAGAAPMPATPATPATTTVRPAAAPVAGTVPDLPKHFTLENSQVRAKHAAKPEKAAPGAVSTTGAQAEKPGQLGMPSIGTPKQRLVLARAIGTLDLKSALSAVKTAATEATALAKAVCHRGQQRAARVRVWSARVKVLGFQKQSMQNQVEHIQALWESFMRRYNDPKQAMEVLCGQFWLIWGELGNLRFCPELLCFLFTAACELCDSSSEIALEEASEGSFLEEDWAEPLGGLAWHVARVVKPIYHVMVTETFDLRDGRPPVFKFGQAPATARACNYDDWNELLSRRKVGRGV
eukprot:g19146.t2